MNWNAPKPTSTFQLAPIGQHKAILYGLIDVGTQDTKNMKGEDVKQRQIYAQLELHGKNAPLIDGKPPVFSKRLTFSMHEKATLRAIIEAITNTTHSGNVYGDGIDILPAVGGACLLQLAESKKPDGSEGRKIQAVMPVDPDAPKPERVNPLRTFNLDAFDQTIFEGLPQYMRELIAKSPEYQALNGNAINAAQSEIAAGTPAAVTDAPFDDEIPF
ncbi:hypothetical protein ABIB06_006576 [Bradyrhizobium sp. LB8.2]|uniref:phage replication initiation protein, NGO0469 family n=1 Tax=unclassified Bradyrhizobium TaxID=2631580 RepID=UPI0033983AF5